MSTTFAMKRKQCSQPVVHQRNRVPTLDRQPQRWMSWRNRFLYSMSTTIIPHSLFLSLSISSWHCMYSHNSFRCRSLSLSTGHNTSTSNRLTQDDSAFGSSSLHRHATHTFLYTFSFLLHFFLLFSRRRFSVVWQIQTSRRKRRNHHVFSGT